MSFVCAGLQLNMSVPSAVPSEEADLAKLLGVASLAHLWQALFWQTSGAVSADSGEICASATHVIRTAVPSSLTVSSRIGPRLPCRSFRVRKGPRVR